MTMIKKLTKDDLAEFQKNLDEFRQAALKFTTSSQSVLYSGAMAPRLIFTEKWTELANTAVQASIVNGIQISQFDEMESLSDEAKKIHIANYAMATAMARQMMNPDVGVNESE